jgi:hypothetical protein
MMITEFYEDLWPFTNPSQPRKSIVWPHTHHNVNAAKINTVQHHSLMMMMMMMMKMMLPGCSKDSDYM